MVEPWPLHLPSQLALPFMKLRSEVAAPPSCKVDKVYRYPRWPGYLRAISGAARSFEETAIPARSFGIDRTYSALAAHAAAHIRVPVVVMLANIDHE